MNQTICYNPATGGEIGRSVLNSENDVFKAVENARFVQPDWADMPVSERGRYLLKVRDYIVDNADELAETISRDTGKTRMDALAAEVVSASMAVSYYVKKAPYFLKEKPIGSGSLLLANKRCRIGRRPFGVIGVISPWNYPFTIPFSEVVMGLLAGNAVLLKTATETQMAGRALERCFQAAGLPGGLFCFLNLPGGIAGEAFLKAGVNKLFFTGSVPVGKQLMALAAKTLTPVSLELGGNDAMLVCDDADLERAATGAVWGGFQNCGQTCAGIERVYVHRNVYDEFMKRLKVRVERLRVGYDVDHEVEMGAMTTERQAAAVKIHIEDALSKGAEIFARSGSPEGGVGNFMPAVVLSNVNHDMLVMREETFGPVLAVMKVDNIDEAVRLANDSNLGLTSSVWSRNVGNARKIAGKIQAGVVMINDHLMSHGMPEAPWGGFKESGIGRTHGEIGFDEMTQPQAIVHDVMPGVKKNLWWHPHGADIYRGIRGIPDMLYAKSLKKRLAGASELLKIFPRVFKADG